MLYYLLYPLHTTYGGFRVFRYISFRLFMAVLTALLISFVVGPYFIKWLKRLQHSSNIREDVPERHLQKAGTPSMGGLLIVFSLITSFVLWGRLDAYVSWAIILCTLIFAGIGFVDDFCKMTKRSKGMRARTKFLLQCTGALTVVAVLLVNHFPTDLQVPFLKDYYPALPLWFFIPLVCLVIVGTSNAVNLTDGLDGLAIGPVLVSSMTFLIFAYVASHETISRYLQILPIEHAGELTVFCGALVGAGLGFLWFNAYPAQVFMGDVGSLSLGAALGAVAVMVKQELLLIVVGGVFVAETVSVIMQVLSFKTTGKRVFRMAPIHHHFELKGWAEPKVIVRFWIVSIILSLLALTTLKLR